MLTLLISLPLLLLNSLYLSKTGVAQYERYRHDIPDDRPSKPTELEGLHDALGLMGIPNPSSYKCSRSAHAARRTNGDSQARLYIDCTTSNDVKSLTFSNYSKLTELPSAFFSKLAKIPTLKSLTFSSCGLRSLPETLGSLRNLEKLSLGGTSVTTLPESLGSLINLEEVDLVGNPELSYLPNAFGSLSGIQKFDLSYCPKLQCLPELPQGKAFVDKDDLFNAGNFKADLHAVTAGTCVYQAPYGLKAWVVQGRPGAQCKEADCSTRRVLGNSDQERHGLRCCAHKKLNSSFMKNNGCTVYHDSFFGLLDGTGNHAGCTTGTVTFEEGLEFCHSMGARMCTKEEVEAGCVKGSGCWSDFMQIWAVETPFAYERVGNGWCTRGGSRIGVRKSWYTTPVRLDDGADRCERECNNDHSCTGYMTKDGTKCQLMSGSRWGHPFTTIDGVDDETENWCWRRVPTVRTCSDLLTKWWPSNERNWWRASVKHWTASTDGGVVTPRSISNAEACRAWCYSEPLCTASHFTFVAENAPHQMREEDRGTSRDSQARHVCSLFRDGQEFFFNANRYHSSGAYCS